MHLIGKDDFLRFDAAVPGKSFKLDRASPEALAGLATGESRALSPLFSEFFADHIADSYTPFSPPNSNYSPTI